MTSANISSQGWVNFPTGDPRWRNTNEGGMFVKLVIVPPEDYAWEKICPGAYIRDILVECLIGDEPSRSPDVPEKVSKGVERHYPHINEPRQMSDVHRHVSVPYLAAIVLGVTSWSGWDEQAGDYWQCTLDDLTPEGRLLYALLRRLFPGCQLHLLTFLST